MSGQTTMMLDRCLGRLRDGDASARDELIGHACQRLQRLAASMFSRQDRLRRWVETDDVLQAASLRLMRALEAGTPGTPEEFFRLAATQIRRELIDLARHYFGPRGIGINERAAQSNDPAASFDRYDPAASACADPRRLGWWTDLHDHIESLPAEERSVCELIWYQGLTQPETARVLGLNEAKVRRCWLAVRLKLSDLLGDRPPI